MIWVPAQLVGAYHGDTVTLTCFVEAHPASLNYWEKDGAMIHANDHYDYSQERGSPAYKVMRLVGLEILIIEFFYPDRNEAYNPPSRRASFWKIYLCC